VILWQERHVAKLVGSMMHDAIGSEYIRPAFRGEIEKWADVSVTTTCPNVVTIRRKHLAAQVEHSALLVVGKNRLDPTLFERCAIHNINRFLEAGWSIALIDFDFTPKFLDVEPTETPPPGAIVAQALAETERLRYVVMLTHSRYAINLSEFGGDLFSEQPISGSPPHTGVSIAKLRLSETAAEEGWVDVFGCLCRHDALWPRELAKVLNWPVRTVYPGYSIYFPEKDHEPRSAIPFTRRFLRARYIERGWAVWLPGSDCPVRVSEPGETARRYDNRYELIERFLTRVISVGLEPVRDFRKRRMYAAHAQR
jgi:hypothetical protein